MRRAAWLIVALIATLVVGGVSYASIPDSSGVVHGCYRTSNPAKGAVTVVDSDAGESCPSGTASLNWNQIGTQGPAGPQGLAGLPGPIVGQRYVVDGFAQTYDSGISFVPCPSGQVPISGSAWVWPHVDGGYGQGVASLVEIQVSPDSPNTIAVVLRSDRTQEVGVNVWGFCAEVQS